MTDKKDDISYLRVESEARRLKDSPLQGQETLKKRFSLSREALKRVRANFDSFFEDKKEEQAPVTEEEMQRREQHIQEAKAAGIDVDELAKDAVYNDKLMNELAVARYGKPLAKLLPSERRELTAYLGGILYDVDKTSAYRTDNRDAAERLKQKLARVDQDDEVKN